MVIRKRDGRIKTYDLERIRSAVTKAYSDIYENVNLQLSNISSVVMDVDYRIKLTKKDSIDIEDIQNIVQKSLYNHDRKVYKVYKEYREKRTEERVKNSKKEKVYKEILGSENTDNDNANVDQSSFSGRKYRIADLEQKEYAVRNLMSKKGRKAFEDGKLYYHDLASYGIGESNCLFSDNKHLLTNGFRTRNGDVRPANSFSTACQLLAVIFQIQSQVQFGGVASHCTDYELEPFVHMSFVKYFKEGLFEKYGYTDYKADTRIRDKDIHIDGTWIQKHFDEAYDYAIRHLEKEGNQSTQALFHNLNTLESRAGK